MGVVSTNEFRKKLKVLMDGYPWEIVDNEFVKPGKGQAFSRVKLKNLLTSRVLDRTFKSGDTLEEADVTYRTMQYLYNDGTMWTFMDKVSFEQAEVQADVMTEAKSYMLDGVECDVAFWNDKAISVTPPIFMNFLITYTEPAVKGDTANNVTKKATLETGMEIDIPLFVDSNMKVKIDTRTGTYVERAKD